jgi:hypothetical protein
MQGYLWIIWVKLAGALWIIGVKIRQLINILFCGYRRSTIRDKCMPKPILARGTGAPASNNRVRK